MPEDYSFYSSLEPMIKKDSLVTFSYGSYEDHTVTGVFLSNVTFNMEEVAKTFWYQYAEKEYADNPDDFWVWGFDVCSAFPQWLVEQGYVTKVEEKRIYLGDEEFFDSYVWEEDFKKQKGIVDE